MAALRHLARWIVWQVGEHHGSTLNLPPAHITVFSTDGVDEL